MSLAPIASQYAFTDTKARRNEFGRSSQLQYRVGTLIAHPLVRGFVKHSLEALTCILQGRAHSRQGACRLRRQSFCSPAEKNGGMRRKIGVFCRAGLSEYGYLQNMAVRS
jgi:hypothetical protein